MKVMLLEDDAILNDAIKNYFIQKGIFISSFFDGVSAYESLSNLYNVCILDIDVPKINGLELLKQIKYDYPNTYIIMLSASIDIQTIEKAYEYGCNDYIKKPFSIKELELKLELLTEQIPSIIAITSDIQYNIKNFEFTIDDNVITLTNQEAQLIELLLRNRSNIISNETILYTIWHDNFDTSAIRKLVSRIHSKLGTQIIQNRVGQGYIIP